MILASTLFAGLASVYKEKNCDLGDFFSLYGSTLSPQMYEHFFDVLVLYLNSRQFKHVDRKNRNCINLDLSVNGLVLIPRQKLRNAFLFVKKFLLPPTAIYFWETLNIKKQF